MSEPVVLGKSLGKIRSDDMERLKTRVRQSSASYQATVAGEAMPASSSSPIPSPSSHG